MERTLQLLEEEVDKYHNDGQFYNRTLEAIQILKARKIDDTVLSLLSDLEDHYLAIWIVPEVNMTPEQSAENLKLSKKSSAFAMALHQLKLRRRIYGPEGIGLMQ